MKKSHIAWIFFGLAAIFCTPLWVIPAMLYGIYVYPSQFARNIDQGKPLVQAVYRYRSATGLYPDKLDDLVPAYLSAVPNDWRYTPPAGGRPPRLQLHGGFHSFLSYYFARSRGSKLPLWVWPEGWEYDQEGTLHFQERDKVPIPPFEKANDEFITARLRELRHRVEVSTKDSRLADAYTRLISELVRLGRLDEAKTFCRQCIEELDRQWCLLALAELDMRRGSTVALDQFVAWTRRSPSFTRYYAISLLYRMHGQKTEALEALREAAKHPLNGNDEGIYSPEKYGFESALFAYCNGQTELALSICDNWEQYVRARGFGERSYHAVRAACYLALGRRSDAVQEIERALKANRESKTWADHLPALERAIRAGDRSFVYDPGECRSDYHIFLDEIE